MRSIVAASVVAICGLTGSAAIAAQRPALCKLVVKGKTYINGLCDFEVIDPDGSFTITGKVHFAYVMVKGNAADATWNRDPKSFHAESPRNAHSYGRVLGERQGADLRAPTCLINGILKSAATR